MSKYKSTEPRATHTCTCYGGLKEQEYYYWDRNHPFGYLVMDLVGVTGGLKLDEDFYDLDEMAQYDVMQDWVITLESEFDKTKLRYNKRFKRKRKRMRNPYKLEETTWQKLL